jgi:hypothetical protein
MAVLIKYEKQTFDEYQRLQITPYEVIIVWRTLKAGFR